MSAWGPVMEPDVLRKNAAGTVSGSMPESMAWDRKFTACATTRHGAVTGDSRCKSPGGTAGPPVTRDFLGAKPSPQLIRQVIRALRDPDNEFDLGRLTGLLKVMSS